MTNELVPTVSIVIPHLNRAELLGQTLASLRSQTFGQWEAIVVDDGSELEQWELAKQYREKCIRVIRRRSTRGKGSSVCRNIGVSLSRGTYIVFVDSDDLLAPWCLEQRIDFIGTSDFGFCVFPAMIFREKMGDSNIFWNQLSPGDDLRRFLLADPPWHTSSPIWKRSTLVEIGGFNEGVLYGDDSDLHIRALLKGIPYKKNENALPDVFVRRGDSPRITNAPIDSLVASRIARLREVSKILEDSAPNYRLAWEGQYMVEAEFLLFNTQSPKEAISNVMEQWRKNQRPSIPRRLIATLYLAVAEATRERAYLALRIARRLAKLFLPHCYFPSSDTFENAFVPDNVFKDIHDCLVESAADN